MLTRETMAQAEWWLARYAVCQPEAKTLQEWIACLEERHLELSAQLADRLAERTQPEEELQA